MAARAGEDLQPGDSVAIVNHKAYSSTPEKPIGIVDPDRPDLVKAGSCFWLVTNHED